MSMQVLFGICQVFAIICSGLNLEWGFTCLFNVGVADLSPSAPTRRVIDYAEGRGPLGWIRMARCRGRDCGHAVTGLAGLSVGAVALRLRRDYLAITTFGIAVAIQVVANNATPLTGGPFSLLNIVELTQAWLGAGLPWTLAYLTLSLAVLGFVYLALGKLVNSPWGRVLRAIREDEDTASSVGKRAFLFRLQSFVIGSMLMGLGGALYAHFVGFIAPEDFLPILTFQLWAMLIVGGAGNNRGAIAGSFLVWGFWDGLGRSHARMDTPGGTSARRGFAGGSDWRVDCCDAGAAAAGAVWKPQGQSRQILNSGILATGKHNLTST